LGGPDDGSHETGLLGILNVMLLLVPALLLMAHVTAHTAIVVGTPRWGGERPNDGVIYCGGPVLEVAITHDGFFTRDDGVGWTRVGSSTDRLDHEALAAVARAWKHDYPHETVAFVSAEADIPFATLVATLDTLRGRDCRLAGALAGEEIPEECLLWQPIVRDREPNHHVPAFRRGVTWPPTGGRTLEPAVVGG
jgi:hypothetical protein